MRITNYKVQAVLIAIALIVAAILTTNSGTFGGPGDGRSGDEAAVGSSGHVATVSALAGKVHSDRAATPGGTAPSAVLGAMTTAPTLGNVSIYAVSDSGWEPVVTTKAAGPIWYYYGSDAMRAVVGAE